MIFSYHKEKNSGWWRSEVTVDIITESPSATEVHYVLTGTTEKGDTKTGNAGSQVTFNARTGLGMNTTYYYRVDVTDGIDKVTGTVKSAKTKANWYCSHGTNQLANYHT